MIEFLHQLNKYIISLTLIVSIILLCSSVLYDNTTLNTWQCPMLISVFIEGVYLYTLYK
jgi:hypothetical protein